MAAHVLEHREPHVGRRVDIASDEISGREMVAVLEQGPGRPLHHEPKQTHARHDHGHGPPEGTATPRRPTHAPRRLPDLGRHSFAGWV